MANVNAVKSVAKKSVEQKQADVRTRFAARRAKLEAAKKAGKVSAAQYEEYVSLLKNKETRALYQAKRNEKPEVLEARKSYNKKRYEDQRAATKRAKELGIL